MGAKIKIQKKTKKMINSKKNNEFDSLLKKLQQHAQKNGFHLNPNKEIVKTLIHALIKRKTKDGEYYCPCRIITGNKNDDKNIICPCSNHKDDIATPVTQKIESIQAKTGQEKEYANTLSKQIILSPKKQVLSVLNDHQSPLKICISKDSDVSAEEVYFFMKHSHGEIVI